MYCIKKYVYKYKEVCICIFATYHMRGYIGNSDNYRVIFLYYGVVDRIMDNPPLTQKEIDDIRRIMDEDIEMLRVLS